MGLAESIIKGGTEVIKKYGKAIVVEDDIVTAQYFLQYMNEALGYYKDKQSIFSVSGYSPNIKAPSYYNDSVFVTQRASSWGWATWHNRWEKADWDVKDYKEFIKNKYLIKTFNQEGEDLTTMLKAQQKGVIDSWAVRWSYTHFKNNAYCLYPVKSKVQNIGIDNSGTHSKQTTKFDVEFSNTESEYVFPEEPLRNEHIAKQIAKLYKPSLLRKMINYIKLDILR